MPKIEETSLPGVGMRHDFTAEDGSRIGVVHHRTGRRELFVCSSDDPDSVTVSLNLSDDDSHALSEALGGSTVIENLASLQQQVEGLAIDWLTVDPGTPYAGKTIGDARIRTRTGVSVVAVIRDEQAFPAPGPEFMIDAEDTLVVVGTPEGIKAVDEILAAG
ncbi:MAG: cation:proton antiporter regulatory subunit [Actinomycetota bacterium]